MRAFLTGSAFATCGLFAFLTAAQFGPLPLLAAALLVGAALIVLLVSGLAHPDISQALWLTYFLALGIAIPGTLPNAAVPRVIVLLLVLAYVVVAAQAARLLGKVSYRRRL